MIAKIWRSARLALANDIVGLRGLFSDFICISGVQGEIVAPYLPAGARVHLISNPIATRDLGRKAEPASGDMIFVGRISPEKGIAAFEKFYYDDKVFAIVGHFGTPVVAATLDEMKEIGIPTVYYATGIGC